MAAATEHKHGLATLAPLAARSRRPPHGLISAPTAPSSRSSLRPSRRPLNVRPNGAILSFKPQADLASDDDGDFPNLQQGTSKPPAAVGSHELEGAHDPNFRASGCSWIPQVRGRPLPPGAGHPSFAVHSGAGHPSFAVHSSGTTRRPPYGHWDHGGRPPHLVLRQLRSSRPRTSGPPRSATLGQFETLRAVLVTAAHMILTYGHWDYGGRPLSSGASTAAQRSPAHLGLHPVRHARPVPDALRGPPGPPRSASSRCSARPSLPLPT